MSVGEWREIKRAWGQLTAAVLVGAQAAGDEVAALAALHEGLDEFPLVEDMDSDELADVSGGLVRDAYRTLGRLLAVPAPPGSSSTGGG